MLMASEYLIELDLSWNELKPSMLAELTKFLKENRTLKILNLSWNSFSSYQSNLEIEFPGDDIPEFKKRKIVEDPLVTYNSKLTIKEKQALLHQNPTPELARKVYS